MWCGKPALALATVLLIPGFVFNIYVLSLNEDIELRKEKRLRSGEWVLVNSLAFYSTYKGRPARHIQSLGIPDDCLVVSIPTGEIKQFIIGKIPGPYPTVTFIKKEQMSFLLHSPLARKYFTALVGTQHFGKCQESLVSWSRKKKDKVIPTFEVEAVLLRRIADKMAVPLWDAVSIKDSACLSNENWKSFASNGQKTINNISQIPRLGDVSKMTKLFSYSRKMDLKMTSDELGERVSCDIASACRLQLHCALASGLKDIPILLKWKLSYDGTVFAAVSGNKSLEVFSVSPLSFPSILKPQSCDSVFPFGIGWTKETAEMLEGYIPDLELSIATLNREGLRVCANSGPYIPCRIEIGADLSAIWKGTGIGSAANICSCIYCDITKVSD